MRTVNPLLATISFLGLTLLAGCGRPADKNEITLINPQAVAIDACIHIRGEFDKPVAVVVPSHGSVKCTFSVHQDSDVGASYLNQETHTPVVSEMYYVDGGFFKTSVVLSLDKKSAKLLKYETQEKF